MALKKPSKPSKSTRNGKAAVKSKKLLRLRSVLWKPAIRIMVKKEMRKLAQKILHAVNSLAGMDTSYTTSGSFPNQADASGIRRLRLQFVSKFPSKLFTANTIYAMADDETEAKATLPLSVVLIDENNDVVNEGPLSSLKVEIFVACGNSKAGESEARVVSAREERGSLLVGKNIKTMENGVCSFNDLKFVDNSSWVPSKMFKLVAKVSDLTQVPNRIEIQQGLTAPFRVKDQRGKSHAKHPIPSLDDQVRRLAKIGIKNNEKLETAGIFTVRDFLQKYYINQSSLKRVLGVKNGMWDTIVEHATKCIPTGEYFRFDNDDQEQGVVELLFNCFYKLISVSFDHQNDQPFDTLTEYDKRRVEHVRRRAFENENKLVQINYPVGWPSANILPHQGEVVQDNEVLLYNFPSYPQSPLLRDHDQEEQETQSITRMEDICSILRSDTLLRDTLSIDNENHPFYMFDDLNCKTVVSKACRVWYRARLVLLFLAASKSNKTRMLTAGS